MFAHSENHGFAPEPRIGTYAFYQISATHYSRSKLHYFLELLPPTTTNLYSVMFRQSSDNQITTVIQLCEI